jgi:hypothetical protein
VLEHAGHDPLDMGDFVEDRDGDQGSQGGLRLDGREREGAGEVGGEWPEAELG